MRINDYFNWSKRSYVMGILNVTPDSFSGDGFADAYDPVEAALNQARKFVHDGADILDVGGESTRPGADYVGGQDEINRVVPVICALRDEFPNIAISIDTYKASVADAAFAAGANILNDVWALRGDDDMANVMARRKLPVILMHNKSRPADTVLDGRLGGSYMAPDYKDFLPEVYQELQAIADYALSQGIEKDQIILDPGVGFGKTVEQNMMLINHLDHFKSLGYPLLLAGSRKSFIGHVLDVPPDQREEGSVAVVALGIARGANVVRVHDVCTAKRIVKMTDAMLRT